MDGDSTSLFYASRAIMRLQAMFGTIPRLQACSLLIPSACPLPPFLLAFLCSGFACVHCQGGGGHPLLSEVMRA